MINFSIIIPVYNRPEEVDELLETICKQTYKDFEIIIVEDGSTKDCKAVIEKYKSRLNLKYYEKTNSGPGTTRNYGAMRASGNYFIFFDSDCLIPEKYLEIVDKKLSEKYLDSYGGPDAAHSSFSNIQKAISYSMTSFFTTGGIRGGKETVDKFHPRSFNMGFSKQVFETTQGFATMRFGEDVDMSLRILENNFKAGLIKEAFVYHKRRTDFKKFFKQVYNSGIARINLYKRHKNSLKLVHFFPSIFFIGNIFLLLFSIFCLFFSIPILLFSILIFVDSSIKNKSVVIGFLSIISSYVQLFGYGIGFISSFWKRLILKKDEFHAFKNNFYK